MAIMAGLPIALLLSCIIALAPVASVHAGYPYVGVYGGVIDPDTGVEGPGGTDHSLCSVQTPAPYMDIDAWIWFVPDPAKGLSSVQFRAGYSAPAYIIQGTITSNPLNAVEIGTLEGGIEVQLENANCQYDWYWTHHQVITLKRTAPCGYVYVAADTNLTSEPFDIRLRSCEPGSPTYTCVTLNELALNETCVFECMNPPQLTWVTVLGFRSIRGEFDWLGASEECSSAPYRHHFLLRTKFAPAETIEVTGAVRDVYNGSPRYTLALADSMVDKTTYVLEAKDICLCVGCFGCWGSLAEFTFDESVVTSASTPAMPLTLYQNKPNPFNPTTTISFYLPQECIVGLKIYDISGRLVTRLIADERRSAGTHAIEWNGRDARGASVASGIYLYRLTAGKETVSKKMVLLR